MDYTLSNENNLKEKRTFQMVSLLSEEKIKQTNKFKR